MIVPESALDSHIAILGMTGSGKSFTARGLVERLLDANRQVCVLDPTGVWWGLRLGRCGVRRGFDNVVLIGGRHGDIPLSPRSGPAVARLVTKQFANVVIDTTMLGAREYRQWASEFADTLRSTIRYPLHLVIDEAHVFMPQSGKSGSGNAEMLHVWNSLISGGRSAGIRAMMITQRPAKLHKDALTCASTLIAMRMVAPQDRKAIDEWVRDVADESQADKMFESMAGLTDGEGWVWYPRGGFLKRGKFPNIKTYDSGMAPKHRSDVCPEVHRIDLDEIRRALGKAVAEVEANDPAALREKIAKLELELKKQPTSNPTIVSVPSPPEIVDRPIVMDCDLDQLRQSIADMNSLVSLMHKAAASIEATITAAGKLGTSRMPVVTTSSPARAVSDDCPATSSVSSSPRSGKWRMLAVLVSRHPAGFTESQWATMSEMKRTGGTWSTYRSWLRVEGFVEQRDRLWYATQKAVGEHSGLISQSTDPIVAWKERVGGKAGEMIDVILERGEIHVDQLGAAVGLTTSGGTFSTYLSRLTANGLVTKDRSTGLVRPTSELTRHTRPM